MISKCVVAVYGLLHESAGSFLPSWLEITRLKKSLQSIFCEQRRDIMNKSLLTFSERQALLRRGNTVRHTANIEFPPTLLYEL